jgi:hypothetical protein
VWFYAGANGWWKFDGASNAEIDAAFLSGKPEVEFRANGTTYSINFSSGYQHQKDNPQKRRLVRRCRPSEIAVVGVAGERRRLAV